MAEEFGTESCFNTVNTEYNAVAMLDSTHVVVAYKDTGGSGYGCAKVGVIDGNTVTWGAENVFNSAVTAYISIDVLDSTHFVVAYEDDGGSDYGCARIGLVSGTTISSYGAENIYNSAITTHISIAVLDTTHFVVSYKDAGNLNYGTGIIGVTDGGITISSYGTENVFNSAVTDYISVDALDSTHFVVSYRDDGGDDYGCACVGVTDGATTISNYGAENIYNSANTQFTEIAALDATHFVVCYVDIGNVNYGTAIVGLVSGTTISNYGAENVFSSTGSWYISVDVLDSTHFVVGYRGTSNYGIARVGTTSGTTISSYESETTFNSVLTAYISVTALSATDYVVVYKDDGGADYGCARVWGTESGWSGIIIGVSSPARVMGVEVANITSVIGIS